MNIRTKPKFINKHPKPVKPEISWVKKLDEYKNLAIIIGFLSYIIGFFLWSLYLWFMDIGYIFLNDFNLVISGLIPSLLICSAFYFIKNPKIAASNKYLISLKNIKNIKIFIALHSPIIISIIGLTIIGVLHENFYLVISISIFGIFFFGLSTMLLIEASHIIKNNKLTIKFLIFYYTCIFFTSLTIFQLLPQEFGGAKPKWVYLDINAQEFSDETLDYLYIERGIDIVSTHPLMTLYSNSDFIVIKKSINDRAIMIKTRYVNSIKSVSKQERASYQLKIEMKNLTTICQLFRVPVNLSCDQFVYPPLKKPAI